MSIDWSYYGSDDKVAIGVDWGANYYDSYVTIAPCIYRWDSQDTDNYGSSYAESLSPDPVGSGYWDGLSWGSGSGTRLLDTFSTRTYYKNHNTQYVTLEVITDSSFGTAYSGSFHTIGARTKEVVLTISPLASYTVSYNANGGTGAPSSQTKWYGEDLTLRPSSSNPTRNGYKFLGWSTSSTATAASYQPGGTYSSNSDVTLYAVWQALTPAAPSNCSHVRDNDSSNTISWTNNSTTANPYSKILIERKTDSGAFVQIASVNYGASVKSYIDNSTSKNHSYSYRVRAYNGNNYSSYSNTSSVTYNTPSEPSGVKAIVQSGTTVLISWTDESNTETGFAIQGRIKTGSSWGSWSNIATVSAGVTQYLRTDAPGGTVQYRVRATRGSLASSYVNSNETVTIQPPAAPTLLNLPEANQAVGTQKVRIYWKHNSLDTSEQTSAQVRTSTDGTTWTSHTVSDSTAYYDISTGSYADGTVVYFKVRTKGADPNYGPDSDVASFAMRAVPEVTITNPSSDGFVLENLPLVVRWTFSNGNYSLSSYLFRLVEGSVTRYEKTGKDVSSISIDSSTFMPSNGATYTIIITAIASTGLQTTAQRTFTVDYDEPLIPFVSASFNKDSLKSEIDIDVRSATGYSNIVNLYVYRIMSKQITGKRLNLINMGDDTGRSSVFSGMHHFYSGVKGGKRYFVAFDETTAEGNVAVEIRDIDAATTIVSSNIDTSADLKGTIITANQDLTNVNAGIFLNKAGSNTYKNIRIYELDDNDPDDISLLRNVEYNVPMNGIVAENQALIASIAVDDNTSFDVIDNVPQLNSFVVYEVIAESNIGTLSICYVGINTYSGRKYAFNYGSDMSSVIVIEAGVKYSENPKRLVNVFNPAGRRYGVAFDGEDFEEQISISCLLLDEFAEDSEEKYLAFRDMQASDTEKVLRVPNGSIFFIKTPAYSFSYDGELNCRQLSIETEVVEGVNQLVVRWLR